MNNYTIIDIRVCVCICGNLLYHELYLYRMIKSHPNKYVTAIFLTNRRKLKFTWYCNCIRKSNKY